MDTTIPSTTRRIAGAACLALFFPALIGATLADPLDDAAPAATQLRQAAGSLSALRTTFLLELLAAVLFLGATMAVVGAVRRRGSAVANAGAVLGVLGGAGLVLIAVGHVYLYALVASGTAGGAAVLDARDAAVGPLPLLLFFAAPFAAAVLAVAAVRGRLAPWPLLVVAAVFLALEFVPTPLGELPALVVGLLASVWMAVGVVRGAPAAASEAGGQPAVATAPAA